MHLPRKPSDLLSATRGMPTIFVHTPKCGGRYVGSLFQRRHHKCITQKEKSLHGHLTWAEYRDGLARIGRSIDVYTCFGLERNPWAWHLSWYNYVRKDRDGSRSGMPDEAALFKRFSLHDYLRWTEDPTETSTRQRYYLRQVSDWVLDENGKIAVDMVMRQEKLREDMTTFRDRFHLLFRVPERRVNVSTRGDYRAAYSSADVDLVARRHARDIALFDYTFE